MAFKANLESFDMDSLAMLRLVIACDLCISHVWIEIKDHGAPSQSNRTYWINAGLKPLYKWAISSYIYTYYVIPLLSMVCVFTALICFNEHLNYKRYFWAIYINIFNISVNLLKMYWEYSCCIGIFYDILD